MDISKITIKGARQNNLKNISLEIPKNKFVVMTGVSGSGKTTLAFNTIFAEGQRRYIDSLSAYVRQMLGSVEKPDVDVIEGLSPAISIDQKTTSNNPRSTVGTVTELNDYLRLLFARVGTAYCPTHNLPIVGQTIPAMVNRLFSFPEGSRLKIMAPLAENEKGTYKPLLEKVLKSGFTRVVINKEDVRIDEEIPELEKNKKHTILIVVDRVILNEDNRQRINEALNTCITWANGSAVVEIGEETIRFSNRFACPSCDFTIRQMEPRFFSFNAPTGACPTCRGIGEINQFDESRVFITGKRINEGGIDYFGYGYYQYDESVREICRLLKIPLSTLVDNLTPIQKEQLIHGKEKGYSTSGISHIVDYYRRRSAYSEAFSRFYSMAPCPDCHGYRLNPEALAVKINGLHIGEVSSISIERAKQFFDNLELEPTKAEIARLVLKEIRNRLTFLSNVGLDYLNLARSAGTLSGGEAQRIRLATQIGTALSGVLYVLDEPSIGLHQRDNQKLIGALKEMRDLGNSLIVVEHDEETMLEADWIIDIGPGAGVHGGEVIAQGTPSEVMANPDSITGRYLSRAQYIPVPATRREGNGLSVQVIGARLNNLKNIDVTFPLGMLIAVSGVSGSGKSTLVNDILGKCAVSGFEPIMLGHVADIRGMEHIDKMVIISQDPIGRTPKSNTATYTGLFDDVRQLFAEVPEAKANGFTNSFFSFNRDMGRCPACSGAGVTTISMHFLPDVHVTCQDCNGKRFVDVVLNIKYRDKSISDVLDMTVDEALEFFSAIPALKRKLQTLADVGLGYIQLGQRATTLSGGEAQRVKLAYELQRRPTGKTLYILDEPTTGLHSDDVKKLIEVLQRLAQAGETVVVIEHNLDVLKCADHIIDLGPEGGERGGQVIFAGTPEELAKVETSYTGKYLKKLLDNDPHE